MEYFFFEPDGSNISCIVNKLSMFRLHWNFGNWIEIEQNTTIACFVIGKKGCFKQMPAFYIMLIFSGESYRPFIFAIRAKVEICVLMRINNSSKNSRLWILNTPQFRIGNLQCVNGKIILNTNLKIELIFKKRRSWVSSWCANDIIVLKIYQRFAK